MTTDQLRKYIRDEEHGLIKRIPGSAVNTEAFYWPKQLLFSQGDEERETGSSYDNIDYFMVRCETHLNNVLDDPSSSVLIVNNDTISVIDALPMPEVNTTNLHNYTMLFAFPGNLKIDKGEEVVLAIKIAGVYNYIPFSNAAIKRVQDFKIVN